MERSVVDSVLCPPIARVKGSESSHIDDQLERRIDKEEDVALRFRQSTEVNEQLRSRFVPRQHVPALTVTKAGCGKLATILRTDGVLSRKQNRTRGRGRPTCEGGRALAHSVPAPGVSDFVREDVIEAVAHAAANGGAFQLTLLRTSPGADALSL